MSDARPLMPSLRSIRLLTIAFVLFAAPVVFFTALLLPPGNALDEAAHIGRADSLLFGQVLGEPRARQVPGGQTITEAGVHASSELMRAGFAFTHDNGVIHPYTVSSLEAARHVRWTDESDFWQIGSIAIYFPVLYVPGAVGIGVSHLLSRSVFSAIIAGRMVNAMCFMLLGIAALQIARRGRSVLFVALCCPMTLLLAGSMNQDGLLIAAAVLATALVSRGGTLDRRVAAAIIACLGAIKPPYIGLALMLLAPLPPPGAWFALGSEAAKAFWARIALTICGILPGLVWFGVTMVLVGATFGRDPYTGGPLWPGDPTRVFVSTDAMAQLQVLLAGPWRLITLPVTTLFHEPDLIRQVIGFVGWFAAFLPNDLYRMWGIAFVCAIAADLTRPGDNGAERGETLTCGIAIILCVWAFYITEYLAWTTVGQDHIDGMQGRYLLPLLGLLAMMLPGIGRLRIGWLSRVLDVAAPVAALWGLCVIPLLIVRTFYMMP